MLVFRLGQTAAAASAEAFGGQHKDAAEHTQQLALPSAELALQAFAEEAAERTSSQYWRPVASYRDCLRVGLLLWGCLSELAMHPLDFQKGLSGAGVSS